MDEGTYGRCANCGQNIAVPRLEALPWARFCVDCQELAEKGLLEVESVVLAPGSAIGPPGGSDPWPIPSRPSSPG